jgi:hypothetical protein
VMYNKQGLERSQYYFFEDNVNIRRIAAKVLLPIIYHSSIYQF